MLNIKLPKGKTATACEAAADQYERKAIAARADYDKSWIDWKHLMRMGSLPSLALPPTSDCIHHHGSKAKRFKRLACACLASIGDVYVSAELWEEIMGFWPND